jgi:V8-like Glu-specific endopeptidase
MSIHSSLRPKPLLRRAPPLQTRRVSRVVWSMFAALALWCSAGPSQAGDEREVVEHPTHHPWSTAVRVRIALEDGVQFGRGSGILVAPCTILTNGHVVYDVSGGKFRDIDRARPGSYYDNGAGSTVDPFGHRVPVMLATNTKYAGGKGAAYDYGAIFVGSSFEAAGITTYVPLSFGYRPTYVNSAGYPNEDLPSSAAGSGSEMWHAFGAVKRIHSRLLYTNATSTGGASGAGVWVYRSGKGERRVVAVNRGHSGKYEGIHVRLVEGNEDVIRSWLREKCPDGSSAARMSFGALLAGRKTLRGEAISLIPAADLGLAPPPPVPTGAPVERVSQVIENTLYQWEEYSVGPQRAEGDREGSGPGATVKGGPASGRYLRLLEPQRRMLSTQEAQVLLSASALWQRGVQPLAKAPRVPEVRETFSVYPNDSRLREVDDPAVERSRDVQLRHVLQR